MIELVIGRRQVLAVAGIGILGSQAGHLLAFQLIFGSAAQHLQSQSGGRVAVMGYCLGGRLAFMMAGQSDADVNISYYGVGLDNLLGDLGRVTKPLVVHIADKDEFFPAEGRAKVVQAVKGHRQIAAYVYPNADHAFARVGGVHWDGRSATIANGRSAEALVAALG